MMRMRARSTFSSRLTPRKHTLKVYLGREVAMMETLDPDVRWDPFKCDLLKILLFVWNEVKEPDRSLKGPSRNGAEKFQKMTRRDGSSSLKSNALYDSGHVK